VREGLTFCLSLPLDYPGGNILNPRRHPPRRFATVRDGKANYNFPLSREVPEFTDVISDDAVLIHTQYSTQWDSLAHVGAEFDADGDGKAEVVYYNGWRGGEDVLGPPKASPTRATTAARSKASRPAAWASTGWRPRRCRGAASSSTCAGTSATSERWSAATS
jgi:hypothetical protein